MLSSNRTAPTTLDYRTFSTLTIRLARLTMNGFLENVDLVVRTLEAFGEEASKRPTP